MIHDSIRISNRYSHQLTKLALYAVILFLLLNITRAFVNCGPWSKDETRKSCVMNQPPRIVVIGTVEDPVAVPLPKPAPVKPKEEWISIRLDDGVLTVRPNVKTEPGDRYLTIAKIQPGDVVEILEREMGWLRIRMVEPVLDQWTGWVKGEFVGDEEPVDLNSIKD